MRKWRHTVLASGGAGIVVALTLFFLEPEGSTESRTSGIAPDPSGRNITLILVDIQNDFWTPDLAADVPEFERNVSALVETCRKGGIDVVHVRTHYDPNLDNWPASFLPVQRSSRPCEANTDGARPLECAIEHDEEPVFIKGHLDGFTGTGLGDHLQSTGTSHVLIAGLYTDVCVLSTALSAFNRGYSVTLIEDCCAAPDPAHDFVIDRYDGFFLNCLPHEAIGVLLNRTGEGRGRVNR